MNYLNLKAFKNHSLYFIHRIISNKNLLFCNKLSTVYFDNMLYYKKIILIYKNVSLKEQKFLIYFLNKEPLLYNTETYYENTNVCIKAVFNVNKVQEFTISLLSQCGQYALNTDVMLEISSYWKEFSHLIFEYEKTQTARESSLGLFFNFFLA